MSDKLNQEQIEKIKAATQEKLDRIAAMPRSQQQKELARLKDEHNALVKRFFGDCPNAQGNHRIRAWVATMLFLLTRDLDIVVAYLGHAGEATAVKHYVLRYPDHLPVVTREMLAGVVVR